ncbi:MAG: hypothetical protein IJ351_00770 [Oscillospiraceae bacterium]|nr:hypothetical protein [Oscillospiraceae bacterium]
MNRCKTIALVLVICMFLLSACHRELPVLSDSSTVTSSENVTEPIKPITTEPYTTQPTTTEPPTTEPPTTEPPTTEPPLSREETIRQILDSRTLIPSAQYKWTVTCTPAVDDRGWGAQKFPHPYAIISYERLQATLASDVYDLTYTDALCKESFTSVAAAYDEAYFEDHILLSFLVVTQQDVLPEVIGVDTGEQTLSSWGEFMNIIAYIDNVTDHPTQPQIYRILLELPASYWDYEDEDFRCDGLDNTSDKVIWEIRDLMGLRKKSTG